MPALNQPTPTHQIAMGLKTVNPKDLFPAGGNKGESVVEVSGAGTNTYLVLRQSILDCTALNDIGLTVAKGVSQVSASRCSFWLPCAIPPLNSSFGSRPFPASAHHFAIGPWYYFLKL
jgi:hypothetical protein